MIGGVSLAGHVAPWVFPGSRTLARRLEERPWLDRGDALLLKVSGTQAARVVAHAIEGAICGIDQRASAPRFVTTTLEGSLEEALFGEAARAPASERDLLRRELDEAPVVLVGVTASEGVATAAHADATRLVELASKIADRFYPVIVTVLANVSRVVPDGALDLGTGLPAGGVLASAREGHVAMWQAYLHTRAAWESGGNLDAAVALGDSLDLARGDDPALETRFAAGAETAISATGAPDVIERFCRELSRDARSEDRLVEFGSEFLERGLMWRPPGSVVARPVPWVARYLLARGQSPRVRPYLRDALACLPLSAELLGVCLELEGVVRNRWSLSVDSVEWAEEDLASWRRYDLGQSKALVFPAGYPSTPQGLEDAAAFVSFGKALARVRARQRSLVPQWIEDLVDLRNALAHGHYVTWRHVDAASRFLENTARW